MIKASLINMYQNLTKFKYGRILTRLRNDQSILNKAKSEHIKELSEEGIIKYERKDDMLFGEWQAQMMLEKGQTTEGVRVDKKIVINPLFKGNFGGILGVNSNIMGGIKLNMMTMRVNQG